MSIGCCSHLLDDELKIEPVQQPREEPLHLVQQPGTTGDRFVGQLYAELKK